MKDAGIDEVDLSRPLEGVEGLDVNYLSRVRTQYLFAQHQSMITQMQFADAKAAALMTIIGLVALRGPVAFGVSGLTPFNIAYLGIAALCILFAFISIFPRYPNAKLRNAMMKADKWSWPALAAEDMSPADYARFMQTSEVSQLVHSVSRSNVVISRILLRKFSMLRIAFLLAILLLALTGLHTAGLL